MVLVLLPQVEEVSTIPPSLAAVMTTAHLCLPLLTPTRRRLALQLMALSLPSTPWSMAPRCLTSHSLNRSRIVGTGPCPAPGTIPKPGGVRCMVPPWSTTTRPRQLMMMANHSNVVFREIPGHRPPCPLRRRPTTTMMTTTVCLRRLSSTTSPPPTPRKSSKSALSPARWPPARQCLVMSTVGTPSRST